MSPTPCAQPNCHRPRKRNGLCDMHRWRKDHSKGVAFDAPARPYRFRPDGEGRPCAVVGCRNSERSAKTGSKGLCETHHARKRDGDPNWQRPIQYHRPASTTRAVHVMVDARTFEKLQGRARARGLSMSAVARGVLEVSL